MMIAPPPQRTSELGQTDLLLHWHENENIAIRIEDASINIDVQRWMHYDEGIHNWVQTAISVMAFSKGTEARLPVPDEFRACLGIKWLHLRRFNGRVHVMV